MTKEMKWMVNTILEEMERMENRINRRFEGIEDRLESMQHEINACKPERDSVSLLIGKVDQLERRIAS